MKDANCNFLVCVNFGAFKFYMYICPFSYVLVYPRIRLFGEMAYQSIAVSRCHGPKYGPPSRAKRDLEEGPG